jgi:hypothetical protein
MAKQPLKRTRSEQEQPVIVPPPKRQKISKKKDPTDPLKILTSEWQQLLDRKQEIHKTNRRLLSQNQQERYKQELEKIEDRRQEIRKNLLEIAPNYPEGIPDLAGSGMTHQHSHAISQFARANDVVMIWRPINPKAATRLGHSQNPYMGKGLNTKGKSSEFGPIAGDIPCIAALSKSVHDNKQISKFQAENNEALTKARDQYQEIRHKISYDNIDKYNDLLLVKAVTKTDNSGRTIYYVVDQNKQIIWTKDHLSPIFVIPCFPMPNFYFFYNFEQEKFEETPKRLPDGQEAQVVEIMAYRQFSIEDGHVIEKDYPITADYDELVSAGRKIFPLHNNKSIRTRLSLPDYLALANYPAKQIDTVELTTNFILKYELSEKRKRHEAILSLQQPQMGMMTDWHRTLKAHLKIETGGATNHGPEVNNPFPVEFSPGNYAVHLPSGDVIILSNEKEICKFINEQRALGFPLDINPKWGWKITNSGLLFVPSIRFDWQTVHEKLAILHKTIESQEDKLAERLLKFGIKDSDTNLDALLHCLENSKPPYLEKADNFQEEITLPQGESLESIVENIIRLRELVAYYANEVALTHLKVNIERLRLEPDIVYSKFINNRGEMPFNVGETDREGQFREEVSKKVNERERYHRQQKIQILEQELKEKKKQFQVRHVARSLIEIAERELQLKQEELDRPKQKVRLSTQPSSIFHQKKKRTAVNLARIIGYRHSFY